MKLQLVLDIFKMSNSKHKQVPKRLYPGGIGIIFLKKRQPSNTSFSYKIESVQYYVALAITGSIRVSSAEKLYLELELEYLHYRRWMRDLCLSY